MDTHFRPLLLASSLTLACSIDPSPDRTNVVALPDAPHDLGPLPGPIDKSLGKADIARQRRALLLCVTTHGALCLINPTDGSVLDQVPAFAIDVVESSSQPGIAYATTWDDEQGGALLEIDTRDGTVEERWREPLSSTVTRLLFAGSMVVGLAVDMGATLFVGKAGGSTGRAVGLPADVAARGANDAIEVTLLEQGARNPRGVTYEVTPDSIREIAVFETATEAYPCGSRLLDTGQQFLLAGIRKGDLVLQTLQGSVVAHVQGAAVEEGCVEDAVWDPRIQRAYVLTGPDARIHIVDPSSLVPPRTLDLTDRPWHDALPRRRLAIDPSRAVVWAALSERLVAWDTTDEAGEVEPLVVDGCSAEAIAVVDQ